MADAKKEVAGVKKELRISYSDYSKLPTYTFTGVWSGFDISTIVSNVRREYHRMKRDQRRAVVSETGNNSTKESA